jgi:4'-phosphopantetheinyl transferase EntD
MATQKQGLASVFQLDQAAQETSHRSSRHRSQSSTRLWYLLLPYWGGDPARTVCGATGGHRGAVAGPGPGVAAAAPGEPGGGGAGRRTAAAGVSGGGYCAGLALARLGKWDHIVRAGADRAPVWPTGIVGSITHTGTRERGFCGVVVAPTLALLSVGLDAELAQPLAEDLWSLALTARERQLLDRQPPIRRGLLASLAFSAKESVYKALFPLWRRYVGFQEVEVRSTRATSVSRRVSSAKSNSLHRSVGALSWGPISLSRGSRSNGCSSGDCPRAHGGGRPRLARCPLRTGPPRRPSSRDGAVIL